MCVEKNYIMYALPETRMQEMPLNIQCVGPLVSNLYRIIKEKLPSDCGIFGKPCRPWAGGTPPPHEFSGMAAEKLDGSHWNFAHLTGHPLSSFWL